MGVGDLDPAHLEELAWLLRDARERTVGRESEWEKEKRRIRDNADPATMAALEAMWSEAAGNGKPAGAQLLDQVQDWLTRFVAYPSRHASVAHTLWIAHTHLMDCWDSTPRVAFLSPEPASGKSRALEVTEPLVPQPVTAVNVTAAYLFRKVGESSPTVLYDEIDTVFGPKAKENEDIRGLLNAGHRRGAVAGRCVTTGKTVRTEEIPAYCAVAFAGIGGLPDTILSRCRGGADAPAPRRREGRRVPPPPARASAGICCAPSSPVGRQMSAAPSPPGPPCPTG